MLSRARATKEPVVLMVDDEAAIRELARRTLEGDGYRVIEASDAVAALEFIAVNEHVDIVIADLAMPVMRGEELASRLRQLRPGLPILFVTAESDRLFDDRPELRDGEAFLDKPFTTRGLAEAVSLLKNGYISEPPPAAPCDRLRDLWRRFKL